MMKKFKKDDDQIIKNDDQMSHAAVNIGKHERDNPTARVELIYTADGKTIPRDVILGFLTDCTAKLMEKDVMEKMAEKHVTTNTSLYEITIEYQRDVMENSWGIERSFGCQYLSRVTQHFPDDQEIFNAAKRFMFIAMRSYVNGIKHIPKIRTKPLQTYGKLSESTVYEFFESCNATMMMPETKNKLKAHFELTQQPPNQLIIDIQREILVMLGIEADFGCEALGKMMQKNTSDGNMLYKFQLFMLCAQFSCREAMMSEIEKKEYYSQIPPIMHHMPYMWIMQQRQQALHEQAQQAAANNGSHGQMGHGHGHHNHAGQMSSQQMHRGEVDPSSADSGTSASPYGLLQELLATEDGKMKMELFSQRMQSNQGEVMERIANWTNEDRQQFYNDFNQREIVNVLNNQINQSVMEKLNTFVNMSNEDLLDMLTLQACIMQDMRNNPHGAGGGGSASASASGGGGIMSGLMGAFSSLTGIGASSGATAGNTVMTQPGMGRQHHAGAGHNHEHHHQHGPGCSHYKPVAPASNSNIITGKTDKMER